MPIASGLEPHSHLKRRAGFGSTSVYAPGRSARAATAGRPRSSGTASRTASRSAASSAHGIASGRPFSAIQKPRRRLSVGIGDQAVHRVRRQHDRLPRPDGRDGPLAHGPSVRKTVSHLLRSQDRAEPSRARRPGVAAREVRNRGLRPLPGGSRAAEPPAQPLRRPSTPRSRPVRSVKTATSS